MKTRIMLGALIMAAVIGSSVGVGYAGSGGDGLSNGAALFQCYVIVGGAQPSPSLVLEVNDQFSDARDNVSVGKLRLLCTPAAGEVDPSKLLPVDLTALDQVTCYDIAATNPPLSDLTISDSFTNQTARLGPPQFLCTSAKCTGTDCPIP
jgi:hypothetical protein